MTLEINLETRPIAVRGQILTGFLCPFCAGRAATTDVKSLKRHIALHGARGWERQIKICERCHAPRSITQFQGHGVHRVKICDLCRGRRSVYRGGARRTVEKKEEIDNQVKGLP